MFKSVSVLCFTQLLNKFPIGDNKVKLKLTLLLCGCSFYSSECDTNVGCYPQSPDCLTAQMTFYVIIHIHFEASETVLVEIQWI